MSCRRYTRDTYNLRKVYYLIGIASLWSRVITVSLYTTTAAIHLLFFCPKQKRNSLFFRQVIKCFRAYTGVRSTHLVCMKKKQDALLFHLPFIFASRNHVNVCSKISYGAVPRNVHVFNKSPPQRIARCQTESEIRNMISKENVFQLHSRNVHPTSFSLRLPSWWSALSLPSTLPDTSLFL